MVARFGGATQLETSVRNARKLAVSRHVARELSARSKLRHGKGMRVEAAGRGVVAAPMVRSGSKDTLPLNGTNPGSRYV
jgi:hypothetical protein